MKTVLLLAGLSYACSTVAQGPADISINAPFVTTPSDVVRTMLKLANVGKEDIVYDLGCGDGRIVIAAARDFGARGVGIEISPEHVSEARENARRAGVAGRTEFREQNFFDAEIAKATVVAIYLLPEVNLRLRPKLFRELKPGARVVSHTYHMGDWAPDRVIEAHGTRVYEWVIPQR